MKRITLSVLLLTVTTAANAQLINPRDAVQNAATNRANANIQEGANQVVNSAEESIKGIFRKKPKEAPANQNNNAPQAPPPRQMSNNGGGNNSGGNGTFRAYNNYDFVAGDKVLFEDDFRGDQDGEFPSHWNLEGGQGVVNTMGDGRVFAVTKYYSIYTPAMKQKAYLPTQYTIEFDTWLDAGYDSNEGVYVEFRNGKTRLATLHTSHDYITYEPEGGSKIQGDMPAPIAREAYHNKWHHIAIAVNGGQMKVYCDQYRVLTVPNTNMKANALAFGGNSSEGMAMLFSNVRIAEGGGMNLLGKKFTDTKIVTHGINFDYNKASIKPESMGTLNMIAQILRDNPDLKFEIGGHTDGDGDAAYNMNLSQQRADAVKAQLQNMGIDGSRLTARGYGKTKPVADNNTPEGKANNRRVEFVKS